MKEDQNHNLAQIIIIVVAIAFAPFMAVGMAFGATVAAMERFSADGWRYLYYVPLKLYGHWTTMDGMDQGFAIVGVVLMLVLSIPAAYAVCYGTWYLGFGIALFKHPLAITPWTNINHYLLPAMVGLLQALAVLLFLPRSEIIPRATAWLMVGCLSLFLVILPLVFSVITWTHLVLRWVFA